MAKNPKPLASYYAGGHRQSVGGVPMRFARPPCGPEDRAARTAGGRGLSGPNRIVGGRNGDAEAHRRQMAQWKAMPIEERLALQDAALARVASVAPTVETEAPAMPENLPAERVEATPTPATLPPEPVSALDGAESATVAASEPEPSADPEPVAADAPDAPVSLADMLRQAADRIEALESKAAEWEAVARAALQREADAESERHRVARLAREARDETRKQREARRRALLARRGERLLKRRAVAQCVEHLNRAKAAEHALDLVRIDLEALRAIQPAAAPAPEPVTPPPAPKPDPVAAARAQMRKMGIPVGVTFHSPNPAQHVRVMVAA